MKRGPLFPANFLWGAATSAYQIEGSPLADGAGPSIWHQFSHTPGLVANGDTGDVACDHYWRYSDDIALMKELGLAAYRFSISWSRILPAGRGAVNDRGVGFYDRLVDGLLAAGITPTPTLFHWDLPAGLEELGGWLNPDIADWFTEYATVMFRALGDRVPMWATLNEPHVVTDGGYLHGALAPGHRSLFEPAVAAHNLLRAHAAAVKAFRTERNERIGIVVNLEPKHPSSGDADAEAARHADAYMNRQFLDPIFRGEYPRELEEVFGEAWPAHPPHELDFIREPIDFLGVNYYTRSVVKHDPRAWPVRASRVKQRRKAHTSTAWEIYPQGLTETLLWVRDRYGEIPLYITENGAALPEPDTVDGPVLDDRRRQAFLRSHLRAARDAIAQGVNLRGYFVWSLLDNFEWSHGYSKRFGIVHVDFATQRRTPKASAHLYSEIIRSNGASLNR